MDEQDNNTGMFMALAIGVGVMAACGVSGLVLVLLATLVL